MLLEGRVVLVKWFREVLKWMNLCCRLSMQLPFCNQFMKNPVTFKKGKGYYSLSRCLVFSWSHSFLPCYLYWIPCKIVTTCQSWDGKK